jgi:hypothetical protein
MKVLPPVQISDGILTLMTIENSLTGTLMLWGIKGGQEAANQCARGNVSCSPRPSFESP